MDDRKDKCECMEKQLTDAPVPVERFSAIKLQVTGGWGSDLPEGACDGVFRNGQAPGDWRDKGKILGLFCSNYQLWKKAADQKEDIALIFEDDVVLHEGFWDKINAFVQSNTTWDFVLLDTYGWAEHTGRKEDEVEP